MTIKKVITIALLSGSLLFASSARAMDPAVGAILGLTIGAAIASDIHHRGYYPAPYPYEPAYVHSYAPRPVYVAPAYYRHGDYGRPHHGWQGRHHGGHAVHGGSFHHRGGWNGGSQRPGRHHGR